MSIPHSHRRRAPLAIGAGIAAVALTLAGCSSSGGMDLSLLGLALAGIGAFRRSRRKADGID